ncbi:MAG: hypothetical protein K8U03_14185 [Planctomycetia bacterium]|nr:hypothetical protein [Planctomycetia bacterium]
MIELLRRVIVSVLLGAAVATYVYAPHAVVRVVVEDPADWYEQAYAPHAAIGATRLAESVLRDERAMLPIAVFLDRHLQGRVKDVVGPEWEEVWKCVQPADVPSDSVAEGCFYTLDTTPLAEVLDWLATAQATEDSAAANTSGGKFVYLRWTKDSTPRIAGLMVLDPSDHGWESVPVPLRNPLRGSARYLVLLALLAYVLPPRPRKIAFDALVFPRASIILADMIGTALTIIFFALPLLIVAARGKPASLLDFGFDGFGFATLVMWSLAGFASSVLFIAAGQAVRQVVLMSDGLRDVTWRHDITIRFEEIASIRPIVREMPAGLRRVLWIAGLLLRSPLLISQLLLFGRAQTPGLELNLRNGTQFHIVALPGLERILERGRAAGIPIVAD